jgi:cytidyltransferase-like protein
MSSCAQIVISGGFDDLRSRDLRFMQEASKLGELTVLLWTDSMLKQQNGRPPKFLLPERNYFLSAIRYVRHVIPLAGQAGPDSLPEIQNLRPQIWADVESPANQARATFCRGRQVHYHVFTGDELRGFPERRPTPSSSGRKKVVVSGSYDWFHSGHVRFFEEISSLGDLYVVVGHDANIRLLKGEGHPLFRQEERRYIVGSIKYVKQALSSSGDGWLDADPEIRRLKPDIYAVNEDGDKGGKRKYCEKLGIEYVVLKRTPAPGLPSRSSTVLRGF